MSLVRAFRGATQLSADSADEMKEAVIELLSAIIESNRLVKDDLISILFTATPDLRSGFPAAAGRSMGLNDVPLICAQEIEAAGALERTVRVMILAYSPLSRGDVQHKYLRGAAVLRPDLGDS